MDKAVLISINPKWCDLIVLGKKTIEVRKTRPKRRQRRSSAKSMTMPLTGWAA